MRRVIGKTGDSSQTYYTCKRFFVVMIVQNWVPLRLAFLSDSHVMTAKSCFFVSIQGKNLLLTGQLLFLAKIYVPIPRLLVNMYAYFSPSSQTKTNTHILKIYLNPSDSYFFILIRISRLGIVHNLMLCWNS